MSHQKTTVTQPKEHKFDILAVSRLIKGTIYGEKNWNHKSLGVSVNDAPAPTVQVDQLTFHSHTGLPPAGRASCLWLQSAGRLVYFVILNGAIKAIPLRNVLTLSDMW